MSDICAICGGNVALCEAAGHCIGPNIRKPAPQPSQAGREPQSSVVLAERACKTEQGKLALYHIAGKLDSLPSYGLIPGGDHMVSWKQVHELLRKAQEGR